MTHKWIRWQHRLHQITGEMAIVRNQIKRSHILKWMHELNSIAEEMKNENCDDM